MSEEFNTQGQFNQAMFLQLRIDILMKRVDQMSVTPFSLISWEGNGGMPLYCFEVMYRDLTSVLSYISPQISQKEREELGEVKNELYDYVVAKPMFKIVVDHSFGESRRKLVTDFNISKKVDELLFEYRTSIEQAMFKHGLGNPTKDDPGRVLAGRDKNQ